MLLRFVISNYLSFDAITEFNTFPGPGNSHPHHIYDQGKVKVLKSTAIYGANGAGKSNLIDVLENLQCWVKAGYISTSNSRQKFRLKIENQDKPSSFLIEFFTAEKIFLYGLTIDDNSVLEEYLYESGIDKAPSLLFKHHENKLRLNTHIEAYTWITTQLIIIRHNTGLIECLHELCTNPAFFSFSNELLRTLDTGIDFLTLKKTPRTEFMAEYDPKDEHPELLLEPRKIFTVNNRRIFTTKENDQIIINLITAFHHNFPFDLMEESTGSKRLLELMPVCWSMIHSPVTIIIDEVEQSIHPVLIIALIKKIMHYSNTKGQLIFTTHESNLLDPDIFRNDEIWFAVKDQETGATGLYSLNDFIINTKLDIRKGYLINRFGAIPFTAPLELLKW
ncbi:ATP-binding protein [Chitinophaga sancti]|uniref:AAA family ATPase n=1 Tax=Chitinophaga sancti TaxID=1004 RepID=UPI002A753346|nr:ATP-binding protein [Chitinophaga sancti]WPQ65930.1 ATP-binding protein [Chitinophaga sancti]